MVIVADRIEARLRDLVEFMVGGARPDFQIALVEVTPYKVAGDTRAFLVPSLHWSRTPSFPPLEFGGKVKWTPKLFQEAIRRNNGDDEVALQMIDEIFSWMQSRAETLAPNAWLDWPTSSSDRPCVNLRIRSLSNALPHLEAVPGGGGWISCRDVMRKHREPLTRFLERIRTLEPYGQLADELLIGRKNDFKMSRDYLGDPEVRSKVLSALEELQDAIIESP